MINYLNHTYVEKTTNKKYIQININTYKNYKINL